MSAPKQKYSNALAREKSPYLLQHAHNPVAWYAWGREAFDRALEEDKPVLLSIGYAACHWCHVMEAESFMDEETARVLNEHFLAIKVDREERPDIDQIYMQALHAMGEQGGWPLNIFLTPDKLPIIGGTYFPPKPLYGRPSFLQILQALSSAWKQDRAKLYRRAHSVRQFLHENAGYTTQGDGSYSKAELQSEMEKTAEQWKASYDSRYGGFLDNGPNKFPPFLQLLFLGALYRSNHDSSLLEIIETSLRQIKSGGIYDQIGGGLSRYSTDHRWLVPHFEKMLYDNAFFVWSCAECYRLTQKKQYRNWALDVLSYIEEQMTSPEGAFYASEDADSDSEEGKFYTWSFAELEALFRQAGFSKRESQLLFSFWNISKEGSFESKNILRESPAFSLAESGYAKEQWEDLLAKARQLLKKERSKRNRPLRDEKILTAWNAYMISALCQASCAFGMPELAKRAKEAADFLWDKLWSKERQMLFRRYCAGQRAYTASLQDYAALGCAFIDLYRTDFQSQHLLRAAKMAQEIVRSFSQKEEAFQALYDTHVLSQEELIVRWREAYDGVEPCGNSLSLRLFGSLAGYGIESALNRRRMEGILASFRQSIQARGKIHSFLFFCASELLCQDRAIVLLDSTLKQHDILAWLFGRLSGESIIAASTWQGWEEESKKVPILRGKSHAEGHAKPYIYLCSAQSCHPPVHDRSALEVLLAQSKSKA